MANDARPAGMTAEQLEAKLSSVRKLHTTVMAVFAVIILAWLVTGYWRGNLALFISTVAGAVTISAALLASRQGLIAEVKRRRQVS